MEALEAGPTMLSVTPPMGAFRAAHGAMATVFEIVIAGEDLGYAGQAAAAAFECIDALEKELSRYIPSSDVARINRQAAGKPLKIGAAAAECLAVSARVNAETGGAFDVTVGRLVDLWNRDTPSADELAAARNAAGMQSVVLDVDALTVTINRPGILVDLGGIGKGYAVDKATALLSDWGIAHGLVNGGASSLRATGAPPGAKGWPLTFPHPAGAGRQLGALALAAGGVSGSGVKKGPHIIDPRTGAPAAHILAAWAIAPTAAEADALSTAFMVMTPAEVERFCARRADVAALLVARRSNAPGDTREVHRVGAPFCGML